ncbi:MAG TPA: DMT family transporter [Gaiellales bacterium]|nr:DMT family transporter [Gaiellales bacterium]
MRHPLAALAAANCIYAGAFPASEVALRTIGPFTLTGLRFLIAGGLLAHIALPVLRRLTRSQRLRLLAVSAVGLWGQMVLIYFGINHANSAIAAIIVGLEPVLIAVWAALLLGEHFSGRTAAGLVVGLCGSLLVAGLGTSHGASLLGVVFLLGTGLAFSWYTVSSKAYLALCSPLELTAVISVLGAVWGFVPMVVELLSGNGLNGAGPRSALMVIYLGVGNSVIGYVLWNRALSGLPAAVVGASLYAQPILGAGLSWLLLRDPLPPTFVPGAVLVLAGVYIASSARRRAPAVPL